MKIANWKPPTCWRIAEPSGTNLEMMLSDHNAYCQPPCQVGCPTHIDIPGYLELIAQGQNREAARLVKEVLPFPYILGLTCPAPCQEVCRRGLVEEEIAICRMHGFAAEQSIEDPPTPWVREASTGAPRPPVPPKASGAAAGRTTPRARPSRW
mgnify:CR=1 FL=1